MLEVGWGGRGLLPPPVFLLEYRMSEVQDRGVVGIMVLMTGYLLQLAALFCAFIPIVSCFKAK